MKLGIRFMSIFLRNILSEITINDYHQQNLYIYKAY